VSWTVEVEHAQGMMYQRDVRFGHGTLAVAEGREGDGAMGITPFGDAERLEGGSTGTLAGVWTDHRLETGATRLRGTGVGVMAIARHGEILRGCPVAQESRRAYPNIVRTSVRVKKAKRVYGSHVGGGSWGDDGMWNSECGVRNGRGTARGS